MGVMWLGYELQVVEGDGELEISLRLLLRASTLVAAYTSAVFDQPNLAITDVNITCLPQSTHACKDKPLDLYWLSSHLTW